MIPRFEPIIQLSACAIIDEQDRLLLLYKLSQGYYEFPGGKVKPNESLEEAAFRETQEEVGIGAIISRHWGSVVFDVGQETMECHKYLASIPEDQTPEIKEPDKFGGMLWIPIANYKNYPLAPNAKEFCKRYLEERKKD